MSNSASKTNEQWEPFPRDMVSVEEGVGCSAPLRNVPRTCVLQLHFCRPARRRSTKRLIVVTWKFPFTDHCNIAHRHLQRTKKRTKGLYQNCANISTALLTAAISSERRARRRSCRVWSAAAIVPMHDRDRDSATPAYPRSYELEEMTCLGPFPPPTILVHLLRVSPRLCSFHARGGPSTTHTS